MRSTLILLAAALMAACGDTKAELQADSQRVAAAAQAAEDSTNAARLNVVDSTFAPALGVDLASMTRHPSGLYVRDLKTGRGRAADSTSIVLVQYTTRLADGRTIDSTTADLPLRVQLGREQLLLAWEEGIRGMRAGGRRLIVAPPSLGYGLAGKPGRVPSMATLVFDIEVLQVLAAGS